ncbi:MAG: hypothetical protein JNK79_06605 [Chitinophagaceae bacterium]|nr:hypothetical protein [Chitinophagaceae bacterium]
MKDFQTDKAQIISILEQFPNYNVSLSAGELKNMKAKTMIILGDHDSSIPLECVLNANNIPNFCLWILPNTGHVAHEGANKTVLIELSKKFFSDKSN